MADTQRTGKLVAIDGYGPDLAATGRHLLRTQTLKGIAGGISKFDASSIFYELRLADPKAPPSPRTLMLLYAADLAFRLRWEIRPALDEGQLVVAEPYIETAIAFGRATGLPRRWMAELFSFAPRASETFRVLAPEPASLTLKRSAGFIEYCLVTLSSGKGKWDSRELQRRMDDYMDSLEKRKACRTLRLKVAVKAQGA